MKEFVLDSDRFDCSFRLNGLEQELRVLKRDLLKKLLKMSIFRKFSNKIIKSGVRFRDITTASELGKVIIHVFMLDVSNA